MKKLRIKNKDILTTQDILESKNTKLENLIKEEVFNIKLQKNNNIDFKK